MESGTRRNSRSRRSSPGEQGVHAKSCAASGTMPSFPQSTGSFDAQTEKPVVSKFPVAAGAAQKLLWKWGAGFGRADNTMLAGGRPSDVAVTVMRPSGLVARTMAMALPA